MRVNSILVAAVWVAVVCLTAATPVSAQETEQTAASAILGDPYDFSKPPTLPEIKIAPRATFPPRSDFVNLTAKRALERHHQIAAVAQQHNRS